jgi:hypothetical protein
MIAELASDERFRKMTTNRIIAMLKRKDFAIGDIRTDRIQHIEKLISKADGGTPLEYDLWRKGDGKQDLTLYLRRLVPIMGCLISDKRFEGHQYLEFDLRERDGCRVFGPANGSLWWQMRLYLAGSVQPTIPHSLAGDKNPYFEHGCADRAAVQGGRALARAVVCSRLMFTYGSTVVRSRGLCQSRSAWTAKRRV